MNNTCTDLALQWSLEESTTINMFWSHQHLWIALLCLLLNVLKNAGSRFWEQQWCSGLCKGRHKRAPNHSKPFLKKKTFPKTFSIKEALSILWYSVSTLKRSWEEPPLTSFSFLAPLDRNATLPAGADLLTCIIKSGHTNFQNLKYSAFPGGNLYWHLESSNEYQTANDL